MRARPVLLALVLALALVACGSKPPPASPSPPTGAAPPVPTTAITPPPAPQPAASPAGHWCWVSDPRKSGCTVEKEQCQKDADEMRARPDTKIASECAQQSTVHCYLFSDEPTPLCYASAKDCDDGRARMADFGTTTECEAKQ